MKKYRITIWEATGFIKEEETDNLARVNELKEMVHERAKKCLPFGQYPEEFKHLVYYYELPDRVFKDRVEVSIREDVCLMNDKDFYHFVEYWKPLYVGAIHRHE